ncbi:MAG: peptide chain release factor 1 [Chthoniobacterales bacterium]
MDFSPLIEKRRARFVELDAEISSSNLFENPKRARTIMTEHAQTRKLLDAWEELQKCQRELVENSEMAKEDDAEMAEMAAAEIPLLEKRIAVLEKTVQFSLLPPDEDENRDAIIEIRAGTGGSEAALFAADLYRMYTRYAEPRGFKIEEIESSSSELGGLKEVIFKVSGTGVFRDMRYESGVHRVQRVPATEAQGRIHTSAATVAVLPEAEEVDFEMRPEDLRIEVCRSGGPGGQGVNTTDSAVQVMYIPTGRIVRCQDGRSQIKNKEKALMIMRSRLLEDKRNEEEAKYAAHRKNQIGSGGREEKIRTYNYPQNRVTDHRIGLTLYNLDTFVQGYIGEMIEALQTRDMEDRLKEAGLVAA